MILTEVSAADLVQCDMKTSDMVTMAGIAAATSQSIIVGRNFEKNGFCKRCCAEGEISLLGCRGSLTRRKIIWRAAIARGTFTVLIVPGQEEILTCEYKLVFEPPLHV